MDGGMVHSQFTQCNESTKSYFLTVTQMRRSVLQCCLFFSKRLQKRDRALTTHWLRIGCVLYQPGFCSRTLSISSSVVARLWKLIFNRWSLDSGLNEYKYTVSVCTWASSVAATVTERRGNTSSVPPADDIESKLIFGFSRSSQQDTTAIFNLHQQRLVLFFFQSCWKSSLLGNFLDLYGRLGCV